MFYGPPGDVQLLLWESQPAPAMPEDVIVSDMFAAYESISEDGLISFSAILTGSGIEAGVNDEVLYVGTPGDFTIVVQAGQQAPAVSPASISAPPPPGAAR